MKKTIVSLWEIDLSNFSEGNFNMTIISSEEAKDILNNSELIWASTEDMFANYNTKHKEKTEKIIKVLNDKYKININFDNFVITDDYWSFINPLNIHEINNEHDLIVINYNYSLLEKEKRIKNIEDAFKLNDEFKFYKFSKI